MKSIFNVILAVAFVGASTASANDWNRNRGHDRGGHNRGGHYHPPQHRPPPMRPHYPQHGHHQRQIWHRNQWHPRPVLRYSYTPLVWGALAGVLAYHRFAQPPVGHWSCVAQSNGMLGNGAGTMVETAQEYALLNCGPACMDGTYQMSCAPRY